MYKLTWPDATVICEKMRLAVWEVTCIPKYVAGLCISKLAEQFIVINFVGTPVWSAPSP